MKKQVDICHLREVVIDRLEQLIEETKTERGMKRVVKIGYGCYLHQNLRFSIEKKSINVRNIKVDRDEYAIIYRFGKRREVKSYFYKTSLLLNGEIVKFCNLCLNELNRK